MIEFLGVGVASPRGGWLLSRLCGHLPGGQVTAVVSADGEERAAVLDCLGGRRVPVEGRLWVHGVPVTPPTLSRIRALVRPAELGARWTDGTKVVDVARTAAVAGRGFLAATMAMALASERRAVLPALQIVGLHHDADRPAAGLDEDGRVRLAVACALVRRPEVITIADVDEWIAPGRLPGVAAWLSGLAELGRLSIVVSVHSLGLARSLADGLVLLDRGRLVYCGPARDVALERALARREPLSTALA
jgi:ABC-type branched-subunit amino acid transport system ATPase component